MVFLLSRRQASDLSVLPDAGTVRKRKSSNASNRPCNRGDRRDNHVSIQSAGRTTVRPPMKHSILALSLFLLAGGRGLAQDKPALQPMDVFRLEFASDPQISPDGKRV